MYVLTVDMPNLEKGMTVEIDGLGFFENGYAYDISKEQADAWRARQRTLEIDHKKDGTMVVREKEGKTLLEASRKTNGIDVRTMTPEELAAFDKTEEDDPNLFAQDPNVEEGN